MMSKSKVYTIDQNNCSTINKELQGTHTGIFNVKTNWKISLLVL